MSLKFEKFHSHGKGNGLRATSLLSAGDQLYSTPPYTCTLSETSYGQVCEFCLRVNSKLLRCSSCKLAKYCDLHCQTADWPDHKRECKCLNSALLLDTIRPIGKTLFTILRKSSKPPCPSEELFCISELQTNLKEQSEDMLEFFRNLEKQVQDYLRKEISDFSRLPDGLTILKLLGIFLCNSFTISNSAGEKIAVGLYPSMSLLNHSCEPNCVVVFDGRILLLRTVREIEVGEELTISYTDTMMPTEDRQLDLQVKYCFKCECCRCQTKELDDQMLAGDQEASDETKELMENIQFKPSLQEAVQRCKEQLEKNACRLPDTNIHQLTMLSYIMKTYMALNRWDAALPFGVRTLQPYRLYNPGFVPMRAQQLVKVGMLLCRGRKYHEALEVFNEALVIMKVTNGLEHSHTQELTRLIQRSKEASQRNKTRPQHSMTAN